MTELLTEESPAALAGAHTGQVVGNIQRLENTMSVALVEVKALEPISHNHALALAYAEYVPVFCASPYPQKDDPDSPRKTPMFVSSWKVEATQDSEIITRWFRQEPRALVAIPCEAAGLLVVDPDVRPPRGDKLAVDGLTPFLELLAENGGTPEGTVVVKTNRGGRHYIYKQLEEPLGNSHGSLPDNCDVRGCGGFFIAPGTKWRGGGWYELPDSPKLLDALRDSTLPEPIEWLVELIRGRKRDAEPSMQPPATFAHERVSQGGCGTIGERERAYAAAALDAECRKVACTPEGGRNNVLNQAAFSLGTLVGAGSLSRAEAEAELARAASACGLPRDEAARTIKSGLDAGELKPRGPIKDEAAPKYTFNLTAQSDGAAAQQLVNNGDSAKEDSSGLKFVFDGEGATTPPPSLVKQWRYMRSRG